MKRRAVLVLSFAALFGLTGPLCVFACIEGSSGEPVAASPQHSGEAPPCHGSAPVSSPEAPAGDHECGCDDLRVVLTKAESSKATGSLAVVVQAPLQFSFPVRPAVPAPARHWKRQAGLPPPDVLLLKSTLLI